VAYIDRQQGSLLLATFICTRQHSEAENSLKLIQVTNISTWTTTTTSKIQTEISTQTAP
jgi:hypothetical protein